MIHENHIDGKKMPPYGFLRPLGAAEDTEDVWFATQNLQFRPQAGTEVEFHMTRRGANTIATDLEPTGRIVHGMPDRRQQSAPRRSSEPINKEGNERQRQLQQQQEKQQRDKQQRDAARCESAEQQRTQHDLPYGGDMQAAMHAQDRDAIRQIMATRSDNPPKSAESRLGVQAVASQQREQQRQKEEEQQREQQQREQEQQQQQQQVEKQTKTHESHHMQECTGGLRAASSVHLQK